MESLSQLSETKQKIMNFLKRQGAGTIADLSKNLRFSLEAMRRHLGELKSQGWVGIETRESSGAGASGRPAALYRITAAGEHLFPKFYDEMFLSLLDSVLEVSGRDATRVLANFTEKRIARFKDRLEGLDLPEKLALLKDLYWQGDPYVELQKDEKGYLLIEYNCPLLNVALQRPLVCSSSVNFLSRLLKMEVIREQRFQEGHGRCVFRILEDTLRSEDSFELEPELEAT